VAVTGSVLPAVPRIEGDGLVLREWQPADLGAMVELFDEPEIARRTPLPSPFTAADAAARLERARSGDPLMLAITTDGWRSLGEVLLMAGGVLGYQVGAAHRGAHLASRALVLLRDFAHGVGFPVLRLDIEPDNTASAAVARRAGFRLVQPAAEVVENKGRRYPLDRWEHVAG